MEDVATNPAVEKVMQILHDYFASEGQSEEEIQASIANIGQMVQDPGAKLIHFRNVVFLVFVRGEGVVEFHTAGTEPNPKDLVQDYKDLIDYLKSVGVKTAYAYAENPMFKRIAAMTKLPWKVIDIEVEGKPMTAYVLEM